MNNNIPGYYIVSVSCCFNCIYFENHSCQMQDNDMCEKYNSDVEPNGYCPDFVLDQGTRFTVVEK